MRHALQFSAILGTLLILAGCGKAPETVVEKFYRGVEKGEVSEAKQLLSKHVSDLLGDRKLTQALSAETTRITDCGGIDKIDVKLKTTGEVSDGKTTVNYKGSCKPRAEKTHMVKEDGAWKIGAAK